MELIWKELDAERLVGEKSVQVMIAGELPTPDGRSPKEVLAVSARMITEDASADKDRVDVSGRIAVSITAVDEEQKPMFYESSAEFTHSLDMEGVGIGMSAEVEYAIQSITAVPSNAGVSMNANVDLRVLAVSSVPLKVTGGVSGLSDLEMNTVSYESVKRVRLGSDSLRMREELAAENAAQVISSEGQILVRDVSIEQGAATVSGVLTVSAVTVDSSDRISQLVRQVPFRERIALNGFGNEVFCTADLDSIYMRALGEEFALVSMEAEVTFNIYGLVRDTLVLPVDAFSPTIPFKCLSDRVRLLGDLGVSASQTTIKETIPLPDNAAELASCLFVSVRPIVSEALPVTGGTQISGILSTTTVFESTAGRLYTFTEDVPFSVLTESSVCPDLSLVKASCVGFVSGTGERSVQVQYTLLLEICAKKVVEKDLIVGLCEDDAEGARSTELSGIVICFTNEGDSVFDIAKRYSVPSESVRRLNPDINEPFKEGEKLILMM